jgi:catechol-2,3-dioxygenase
MKLSMRRIVLFTNDMPTMVSFYRDVLGLSVLKDERGWKEFDANGCVIALHNAPPMWASVHQRSASGLKMLLRPDLCWLAVVPSS